LQNGREFMEIERNPQGVLTYKFQNECKSMHLIVAEWLRTASQMKEAIRKALPGRLELPL
jgi:hypothetical protein